MSFITCLTLAAAALTSAFVAAAPTTVSQPPSFTTQQIKLIRANAVAGSLKSWEIGTLLEALTELDAYPLSAFGAKSLPVNASSGSLPQDALAILDGVLDERPATLKPFVADGSSGDPCSIGPFAVVAGITTGDAKYTQAAADQLDWALHSVPRDAQNITVSHRQEQFQAWADFVSMVPPFFGMYAASEQDGEGLMWFAYQQIQGYRELLRDPDTGIWRHIVQGNWNDTGLWATGNAWAAHGALRVEAAIRKGPYGDSMAAQARDIQRWVGEIIEASWNEADEDGLLHNYMRQDTFADTAGSALLAAATYRHAVVTQNATFIPQAEKAFRGVLAQVDDDGWVHSAVDPYNFRDSTDRSPEAESFLLLLHVASDHFYNWQDTPARVLANALLEGLSANVQVDA